MSNFVSIIIPVIGSIIVELIVLCGVIYNSNKKYNQQQREFLMSQEKDRAVLQKGFEDYKEFLKQVNKDLKEDIVTLSSRVDEHNNYGRKIPVIENTIEDIKKRLDKLEDK